MLRLSHDYEIKGTAGNGGSWQARTAGYIYELSTRTGEAILGFHWHPSGSSPEVGPHLHVYGRTEPVSLRKAHLPTGLVTLPAVVRMAIRELGVEPLRPGWAVILDQAEGDLLGLAPAAT